MRPVDPRLLRASRPARAHLGATFAIAALSAVVVVAQAALLAHVVARAVAGDAPGTLRGSILALLGVLVLRALADGAFDAVGRFGAARVMSDLRGRLAEHLLVRRPGVDGQGRTGEIAALAVQGIDAVEPYFARFLPQLALASLVPPAILVWVLRGDWIAALILAGTIPLIPLFMALVGMATQAHTRARWRSLATLSAHFLDVVGGLPTLRAHARDAAQARALEQVGEAYRRETMGTLRVAFLSALVLELLAMIGTALVAGTVGVQLAGGHLGLEAGLCVLLLAPELYSPLRQVGAQFHASADGLQAAQELQDALQTPGAVSAPAHPCRAPRPDRSAVRFQAVGFTYPGRDLAVLDGLDLELAPGATTALVGASGAGKSTIAALALRLADPTAGRITCGGVDLLDVPAREWRAGCAWLPQHTRLFTGTVADNLRLGRPGATDAELHAALEAAGARDVVAALPGGLDTRVGDGGRRLSAGEAQRLAIARAFVRDAPMVVLDEPTAHLDEDSAVLVGEALQRLAAGRTTLLVVHRPALAAIADHVVHLGAQGACVAATAGALSEVAA
ncbi:thiol reductant ABC exporter subunit CydD [Baekduia soli]|uniref:Thiol reductant ABC exporter subunit CydD n=1 Tax=Baekduia soli TaxID=496014 RepID=A0A5B8U9W9_9ACTN|nr:thiol reductant ABC exporter subunit CydD [Baekduia soli]QEC49835.1 thiol reductant ABC exporter subunit CydD [Baekduia soli]